MTSLSPTDRRFLVPLSELSFCNPFEPVRIELEQATLGADFTPEDLATWSRTEATDRHERPNILKITKKANRLVEQLREEQLKNGPLNDEEAALYDDLVTYVLYYRHLADIPRALLDGNKQGNQVSRKVKTIWQAFRDDRGRLLEPFPVTEEKSLTESAHLFACLYQVRRAFLHIFDCLIGESAPAAQLRAQVWQSIFTHDLRRYRRTLYKHMGDLTTLVTGPSGSGKELVARAIGLSQYRSLDTTSETFACAKDETDGGFIAINLSAMSPTLIESELFGHCRGSFTGATADRAGWLERCPAHGAIFLDEIGELDPAIQVKLLRVVQTRQFSRLGESEPRQFVGKLLSATNRDLAQEMREDRFREDLYYRLCSDQIVVPALSDHFADRPEALTGLVRFLSRRILGNEQVEDSEVESLAKEVETWIQKKLPADYAWPGNIRELEQCVRNVLVRREYWPAALVTKQERADWLDQAAVGKLTADELLTHYCKQVYEQRKGYEQTARVLGLDRRTVKSRVDR